LTTNFGDYLGQNYTLKFVYFVNIAVESISNMLLIISIAK